MAYDDSGELSAEQKTYSLGGYSFDLKVENVHEPGEPDVVSVFAICHSPDGNRETVPKDFPSGTKLQSWRVEANETEATVYATLKQDVPEIDTGNLPQPFAVSDGSFWVQSPSTTHTGSGDAQIVWFADTDLFANNQGWLGVQICSSSPNASITKTAKWSGGERTETLKCTASYTYQGKTVYYYDHAYGQDYNFIYVYQGYTTSGFTVNKLTQGFSLRKPQEVAWAAIYGNGGEEKDAEEVMIARFAIDIREADGGPDGDWDEPGDTGDPSYTLNVSVTGASSGSNNGTPLEPGQTGGYGNGGTGGNGGGGGAGASTVIIYDFATDKAGTVNQEATAQGPGTGGPGGKGGKGGDGCILIFY